MARRWSLLLLAPLLAASFATAFADDAPAPAPAPPVAPAPAAADAERELIKRLVAELRAEAATIRGLAWKFEVPADLVTRDQMRADFMEELKTEYPEGERDRDLKMLRRLGMLGPDQDHVAMIMDVMQAAVGGYYDPKAKHLRIVEGFAGEAQRPVILHELIHALEDQYIDLLGRAKPFEDDSDRTFAEKCITEGSAEHARELYEKAHPDIAAAYLKAQADPKMAMAQMKAMQKVPAYLFVSTLMHYQNGPAFVGRAMQGGTYPERMAALYAEPPVSQEQILHPGRWFTPTRDYPQAIVWGGDLAQAAGEGWKLLHQMPSGELDLALFLDFHLGPTKGKLNMLNPGATPFPAARKAAAGWDAGQTAFLEKEGLPLAYLEAWAFDSDAEAWEAAEMLVKAAQKQAGEAWQGGGWVKERAADGTGPVKATLDYVNQHGSSRLMVEGAHVLRVDGVPPEVLGRLWPVVLKTAFVRDARDTWDPSAEARLLDASSLKDEARGLGVSVPSEAWKAEKGGSNPSAFATLRRAQGAVEVMLVALDRVIAPELVLMGAAETLKKEYPSFSGESAGSGRIGDADGLRAVLGADAQGRQGEIVIASGVSRLLVARISAASAEALEAARAEIEKILASVVTRD